MIVNQFPDRTIFINQKEYLYFGGTAYLGLPTNKAFQDILIKNIKNWGSAYGSSRNANIQLQVYNDCESFLAKKIETEAALTVSSGMLAGNLVLEQLTQENSFFYTFKSVHKAILPKNSLPFFIEGNINPKLLNSTQENIVIVADAIPAFEVIPDDFSVLNQISSTKNITLVLDESHTFGILDENGNGIFSTIKNKNINRKIMISSLGKAYGLTGGVIASDFAFIEKLKNHATFLSAAGLNPAFAQTIVDSEKIIKNQLGKLKQNLIYFDGLLENKQNYLYQNNYPLIYFKNENISDKLEKENIIITNFNYANSTKSFTRIVISANHTIEDIKYLSQKLNKINFL